MRPTREQIEIAAYHRWERRGRLHGGNHDDWVAAEKDLVFGLNYRSLVRYPLDGPPVLLGKAEAGRTSRRCRFCEQAEPAATFSADPPALLALPGNSAPRAWDECDDCRATCDSSLAGAFESFSRTLLGPIPQESIPLGALKALIRMGVSILPTAELHHFGDTIEWVTNPDHDHDASLLADLGCHVYRAPTPVAVPFVALARRVDDEAPWPYLLVFLATPRLIFQTHLPLCNCDEDLDETGLSGPELSMSLGPGPDHRASLCVYLPVARPTHFRASRAGRGVHEAATLAASSA